MALAGMADYGSSSEDEAKMEEGVVEQPAADKPKPKPKPTTLLPSADELFDSIDAPAFFGGAAAAKRQAAEITASRPTPQAPQQQHPPRKKQATAGGPKAVESPASNSLLKAKPGAQMLPPQVSRQGGRNVVTEDRSSFFSRTAVQKAKEAEASRRKSQENGSTQK